MARTPGMATLLPVCFRFGNVAGWPVAKIVIIGLLGRFVPLRTQHTRAPADSPTHFPHADAFPTITSATSATLVPVAPVMIKSFNGLKKW